MWGMPPPSPLAWFPFSSPRAHGSTGSPSSGEKAPSHPSQRQLQREGQRQCRINLDYGVGGENGCRDLDPNPTRMGRRYDP